MTRHEFDACVRLLAGLPFPPQTLETLWTGTSDMPADAFRAACEAATRTCPRFPSPYELRQLADLRPKAVLPPVETVTALPAPLVLGVLPTGTTLVATAIKPYACEDCSDTGWFSWWCGQAPAKPWYRIRACERTGPHLEHEYVEQCACYLTNPVLVRKRETSAQYASQRLEEGRRRAS